MNFAGSEKDAVLPIDVGPNKVPKKGGSCVLNVTFGLVMNRSCGLSLIGAKKNAP